MKLALITTLMVLSIEAADAQSTPASSLTYTNLGVGTHSCGSWVADKQADAATSSITEFLGDQQYVLGYIVGLEEFIGNATSKNMIINTDVNGVVGWIDNYCMAHPVVTITDAAQAFALSSGTIKAAP
jgi:hypothetical protein